MDSKIAMKSNPCLSWYHKSRGSTSKITHTHVIAEDAIINLKNNT